MPDDFLNDLPLGDETEELEAPEIEEAPLEAEAAAAETSEVEQTTAPEVGPAMQDEPPAEPDPPPSPENISNELSAKLDQDAERAFQAYFDNAPGRILGENNPRHQREMERRKLRSTR